MFCNDHRESREMLVEINGILSEAMDSFLTYVYTGRAKITTENVQFLFETSSLFQIYTLRDACAKFLEDQLDPCNCLGIQRFAEAHALKQLASRCRSYAMANFAEVAQHEEFLDLRKEELEEYTGSDELSIGKEEVVFWGGDEMGVPRCGAQEAHAQGPAAQCPPAPSAPQLLCPDSGGRPDHPECSRVLPAPPRGQTLPCAWKRNDVTQNSSTQVTKMLTVYLWGVRKYQYTWVSRYYVFVILYRFSKTLSILK